MCVHDVGKTWLRPERIELLFGAITDDSHFALNEGPEWITEREIFADGMLLDLENFRLSPSTVSVSVQKRLYGQKCRLKQGLVSNDHCDNWKSGSRH